MLQLFPQIDALIPGGFGSWSSFAKYFCNAGWRYFGRNKRWVTDGAANLEELQDLLSKKCMVRRLKKDVLTQLPPKQRQRVLFPLKECNTKKELDKKWKELDAAMGRGKTTLSNLLNNEEVMEEGSLFDVRCLITEMYRHTAACKVLMDIDGAILERIDNQGSSNNLKQKKPTCNQTGPVREYVKMLCENGGLKFIIFAHHHVMLDAICLQLHNDEVKYIRIDGKTDQQLRPQLVHNFQGDQNVRVAVLSIKAAGVGLTLTAAKLVVFAELDWTPGVLVQCEDRAHRIGQKETVHIHYLVAKGTLDEWVWTALSRKTAVVTTTLNGKRQTLSMDEANRGQIEVLANADEWVPKKKTETEEEDMAAFFASQQLVAKKQRNIKDFFTPKGQKRKSNGVKESSPKRRCGKASSAEGSELLTALNKDDETQQINDPLIVLDSDDDQENSLNDFNTPKSFRIAKPSSSSVFSTPKTRISASTPVMATQKTPFSSTTTPNIKAATPNGNNTTPKLCTPTASSLLVARPSTSKAVNSKPDQVETDMQWSCTACTFLNHEALPACEICFEPKPRTKQKRTSSARSRTAVTAATAAAATSPSSSPVSSFLKKPTGQKTLDLSAANSHDGSDNSSVSPRTATEINIDSTPPPSQIDIDERSEVDMLESSDSELEELPEDCTIDDFSPTKSTSSLVPYDGDRQGIDSKPIYRAEHVISDSEDQDSQPMKNDEYDKISEEDEAAAAVAIFTSDSQAGPSWVCPRCECENGAGDDMCEVCLCERPEPPQPESRHVNLDSIPKYERFQFCCSRNTSRIYLYDESGNPLHVNFLPLDVKMESYSALPDLLLHPYNLARVKRFVREWDDLEPTKRRIVIKAGLLFCSPKMHYEEIKRGKSLSKQRYATKKDVAVAAIKQAEQVSGSVRTITKPSGGRISSSQQPDKENSRINTSQSNMESYSSIDDLPPEEVMEKMRGIHQAVAADGTPLCIKCQKPYSNSLVTKKTVRDNPWVTRFCSKDCADQYWIVHNRDYGRKQVFQEEGGVCQICKFEAETFYQQIRMTTDKRHRAELIQESKYKVLTSKVKQAMVNNPKQGQFWHADHIQAVSEGGGQCDIDNLRTLCTPCHRDVTHKQNVQRAANRKHAKAAQSRDITAFFKSTS